MAYAPKLTACGGTMDFIEDGPFSAPYGYVLMPLEPTEDMILKAIYAYDFEHPGQLDEYRAEFLRIYQEVIATALDR